MRFYLTLILLVILTNSCIKKDAIKADKNIVGTWVSNDDSYITWLIIDAKGNGTYRTYDLVEHKDSKFTGDAKYNLFEKKLFIGATKFQVNEANTDNTGGISEIKAKVYSSLKDTIYSIDRKLTLKTSVFHRSRVINFYRLSL